MVDPSKPNPWRNGDEMEGRSRRPCVCGGTMYDWGVGVDVSDGVRPWIINWKCHGGCGRGVGNRLSHPEMVAIRNGPQAEKDVHAATLSAREHWDAWPPEVPERKIP